MSESFSYSAEPKEIRAFIEDLGYEVKVAYSPDGKEIGFDILGTTIELGYDVVVNGKLVGYGSISMSTIFDHSTHTFLAPEKAKRSKKLYQELKQKFGKPPKKN